VFGVNIVCAGRAGEGASETSPLASGLFIINNPSKLKPMKTQFSPLNKHTVRPSVKITLKDSNVNFL
jgi:hypothetical protein